MAHVPAQGGTSPRVHPQGAPRSMQEPSSPGSCLSPARRGASTFVGLPSLPSQEPAPPGARIPRAEASARPWPFLARTGTPGTV